jgi:hypothetical protein
LLAHDLNVFLEGITASADAIAPASVEDIIAEGESDELEFKSSIRWDYKERCVNKKLEEVILKSIAAFANGQVRMGRAACSLSALMTRVHR